MVMKGIMSGMTPPETVNTIEDQLERAYWRGVRDERLGKVE